MNEKLKHLTELFKSNISTAVREHKDFRPFYCEGDPYKANVFLIGQNPATPDLRVSWWDFWSETQGFDFKRFDIVNEKKRGGEPSKTRKLLDELKPRLNTLYWGLFNKREYSS